MNFYSKLALFTVVIILNACFKSKEVDTIIYNAKVHVMNEKMDEFDAIAIKDGQIIDIGPEREILNAYSASQEINARQKDVYPGFHDAHGHMFSYAEQKLIIDLSGTKSYHEMIERIEQFDQKFNPTFLIGRGWDQGLWGQSELPINDLLNESFKDKPVFLTRIDGHAALLNDAALELASFNSDTKIEGGKIISINQKPTGIILDNAIDEFKNLLPNHDQKNLIQALKEVENELFSYGITNIHEAGINRSQLNLLIDLYNTDQMKLGIYAMLYPTEENFAFALTNGIYHNKNLQVQSFKLVLDGALGSRGACLIEPYHDLEDDHGFLLVQIDDAAKIVEKSIELGYQLNTHCIGDSANRVMLKLYNKYLQESTDHRWRIEHAQVMNEADMDLFITSGAIPSVQPTHATSDFRWAADRIGQNRLSTSYAYLSLFEKRKMIVLGTDFPVESIDPFATIHAAINRKNIHNEPEGGFGIDQALSLDVTLKAMTTWPSFASFQENFCGTLEKGKNATLVIIDHPIETGNSFKPNYAYMTFVNGELVYSLEDF